MCKGIACWHDGGCSWMERKPMKDRYMARRLIELYREWVRAGKPRKDEKNESGAA